MVGVNKGHSVAGGRFSGREKQSDSEQVPFARLLLAGRAAPQPAKGQGEAIETVRNI